MASTNSTAPAWKKKAATKRVAQFDSIPKEWRLSDPKPQPKNAYDFLQTSGLLTSSELRITETIDAQALLAQIANGELSAVAVTTAFSKRAAIAQQLIGCCTEMFFAEAIETATRLDEYLKKNGKTVGPLHGLPVSVKDVFSVTGQDTTVGWTCAIGQPAKADDVLVSTLRKQGAVLYVKTNIPQSLMMSDSYNHVFKQSLNAFHRELISGGSSGGEGALVGALGSVVGIGTDIGGSIRIPANLQGLYGLQPSTRRIPYEKSGSREYIVPGVAGPMTTTLSSLEVFMDGFLAGQPWLFDPVLIPLPWRSELAALPKRPLKIGYYLDDGHVRVQPPCEVAVNKAVSALREAGHHVFHWEPSEHEYACKLWERAVMADGGKRCQLLCEKEGEPLIQGMVVGTEKDRLNVDDGNALAQEIRDYQKRYLQKWHDAGLDALIMPVQPWVGFKPKTWVKSSQWVGYSSHWNLLDWAVLAAPIGVAEPEKIDVNSKPGDGREAWAQHKPRNESDRFNWEQYDPSLVAGMPVGIQIVGGKFGEENAVSVAKALEAALRTSDK